MTHFLIRLFIRQPEKTDDPDVRYAYGKMASIAGIAANVLLFLGKLLAGWLSGNLAMMADAFNNLSDAGSSVVTLVGFRLSAAPPDAEHPFGHGRVEYLSAMAVAAMIMVAGFELVSSSFDKILHPDGPHPVRVLSLIIVAVSILVKLWMALFYRKIGDTIHSDSLKAACADSRNDVVCTAVVLISALVGLWKPEWPLDGYVGVAVALFVMYSGFSIMKKTISPLLGEAPDPKLVQEISDTVLGCDGIIGIHDLIIHNYGPGRIIVSLHAEVPAKEDILKSHEIIDAAEQLLMKRFNVISCIHMDPVDLDNERVEALRETILALLADIDPKLTMHDFRVVFGSAHTNLIFDVVAPFAYKDKAALCREIQQRVQDWDAQYCTVVLVEHSYSE